MAAKNSKVYMRCSVSNILGHYLVRFRDSAPRIQQVPSHTGMISAFQLNPLVRIDLVSLRSAQTAFTGKAAARFFWIVDFMGSLVTCLSKFWTIVSFLTGNDLPVLG